LLAVAIGGGLFILDNNNNKRKIFSRHGIVMWPRWSVDGKRLRFTVEDSSTFSSELWEVRADGTNEHRLLPGWNKPSIECCGEWTRDGSDYVFQTGRLDQFNLWSIHEGWFGPSKPVQLTSGPLSFSAPLPSVDGKWLYMLGTQHRTEVAQLNRASGLGTLISWLPSVKSLDYSRDGKWVTYVTDPGGILWRSRADGSDRLQLTYPPLMALSPRWSPDGTKVAFTALRSGKPLQIEIIPSDGGTSQPVYPEARNQGSSSWSADGQTIFLGRLPWLETDTSLTTRIAKVDLRTHELSEIPGSEDMFSPVLSPGGNHLAAKHGAAGQVALLDLATGEVKILTETTDYRPVFSTDSQSLYFTSRNEELAVYSLATREIKRIRTQGFLAVSGATLESSWFLGTGPDGSPITVRDERSTQLYAMRWKK
jgi:Tol biopolymer transport system component